MKTLILILLSFTAFSQKIEVKKNEVWCYLKPNQRIEQGFKLTNKATTFHMKHYRRYVVKDGITYFRPGIRLSNRYYQLVDLYKR